MGGRGGRGREVHLEIRDNQLVTGTEGEIKIFSDEHKSFTISRSSLKENIK